MMKLFSRPRRAAIPAAPNWLEIYYVRTGERNYGYGDGEDLTLQGRLDAAYAAMFIRDHANGEEVVVFGDSTDVAYHQTAGIIAETLQTSVVDPLFRYEFSDEDLIQVEYSHLRNGVNRFAIVENGSMMSVMLRTLPGPVVQLGHTGPPYGSVHILRVNLTKGIGGKITEKFFV